MKQISSMDLFFLVKEFKILENCRIDSIYLENNNFYFKIYIKNQGNKFLIFNIGKYIYLDNSKDDNSKIPTSFISYLRKNLKNTFIRKIEQIENERILKITIEKKINENTFEILNLYLELFAPGNIILTNKKNIILNMFKRKKFKDRKIIAKEEYIFPPKNILSIFNINRKKLEEELKNSDLSIVKFLAIKFGLGGKFAEEIIYLSKIKKDLVVNKLNKKQIEIIIKIIEKIKNKKINSNLILDSNENIIDFIPFDFKSIGKKKIKLNYFNETIKTYFSNFFIGEKKDSLEKEFELQLKKLENRLKKQELIKEQIKNESLKFTNIGNKIYENYSIIEELLNTINESTKKIGWDKTLKKINESKNKKVKIIKKIDYKKNLIILDL